jgi:MFS family permease
MTSNSYSVATAAGATATTTTHQPLRHRWKILAIGVFANASFAAAFAGIPVTAIIMRTAYRLDNTGLGLVLGALGLGVAVSELPWGLLTDRWGDRRVLLSGLCSTALALMAMACWLVPVAGSVPAMPLLALGLLLVGMLGGSVNGASGRAVMGWFQEGERGLAMSIRQTAVPVGGGIGAIVLPALAVAHGFAAVYGVLAFFCAASAWLTWRWLHEPPVLPSSRLSAATDLKLAHALRNIKVWRMALATGILCFPQVSVLTFATIFLHDVGHVGLPLISVSMMAIQIGAAVTRIGSGRWTDRHGNRRRYLRACSAVSAGLFVVLAVVVAWSAGDWSHWLLLLIVGLLVAAGICASAWHGVAYTELATLAGAGQVGAALGLGNTCVFLVFFLAAQAVPLLLRWYAWPAVWLAGALAAGLAWPLFLAPSVRK